MALIDDLAATLARLSDADLEAMSSRGLVRRARKDLDAGVVRIEAETDANVIVETDDARVTWDRHGLAGARCSCASSACCRHILAATMALARSAPAQVSGVDLHAALMGFTTEDLARWAGRSNLSAALERLAATDRASIRITVDQSIEIALDHPRMTVNYVGGSIESLIFDRDERSAMRSAVLAVLGYQRAHGDEIGTPAAPAAVRSVAASDRSGERLAVIARARTLVSECIDLGLAHLGGVHAERFATLAVSAIAADLPRLGHALRRLSEGVTLFVSRAGGADEVRLFDESASTYALSIALENALRAGVAVPTYLTGEHRTAYASAGTLHLLGMGSYPWETRSNHSGVTALFWSPAEKRFVSASRSRAFGPATSIDESFVASTIWDDATTMEQLAGAAVTLVNAQLNASGRISASRATQPVVRSGGIAAETRFAPRDFDDWDALYDAVRERTMPIGLQRGDPHDDLVVLRPSTFERAVFDPVMQRLVWRVADRRGAMLRLEISYGRLAEHAIARLESLEPAARPRLAGVVARVRMRANDIFGEPLTLLLAGEPLRVESFFLVTTKNGNAPMLARVGNLPAATDAGAGSVIERLLDPIDAALLRSAERGTGNDQVAGDLQAKLAQARRAGLSALHAAAGARASESLLILRYLTTLYRDASRPH